MPALPATPPSRSATRQPSTSSARLRVEARHLPREALGQRDVVGVHAREERRRRPPPRPRSAPRTSPRPRRGSRAGGGRAAAACASTAALPSREPSSTATTSKSSKVWARSEARQAGSVDAASRTGRRTETRGSRPSSPAWTRRRAPRAPRSPATGPPPRRTDPPPPAAIRRAGRAGSPPATRPGGAPAAGSRTPSRRGAAWNGCRGWRRDRGSGTDDGPSPETTSTSAARLSGGMKRNSTP